MLLEMSQLLQDKAKSLEVSKAKSGRKAPSSQLSDDETEGKSDKL